MYIHTHAHTHIYVSLYTLYTCPAQEMPLQAPSWAQDVQAAHEKNMAAAQKVAEEAQAAAQEAADAFVGGVEQAKEVATSAAQGASELGEMMHEVRRLLDRLSECPKL